MDIQLQCNRLNNRNNRQTKGSNCFFNKILIITLGFLHHLPNHNMASLLGLRTFYKVKSLKQDLTEGHTDKHKKRITSICFFFVHDNNQKNILLLQINAGVCLN